MATHRWCPPLLQLGGRFGPTAEVDAGADLQSKLEQFALTQKSCCNFWERRLKFAVCEQFGLRHRGSITIPVSSFRRPFIGQVRRAKASQILLRSLYFQVSPRCRDAFRRMVIREGAHAAQRWFYTADGVLMPSLLAGYEPDYITVNRMQRWCLECCANNYALFQASLKEVRKIIRKAGMISEEPRLPLRLRWMKPYLDFYRLVRDHIGYDQMDETHKLQVVCLFAQTRATGLADAVMVHRSIDKFVSVVTQPSNYIRLDPSVLAKVTWRARYVTGRPAKLCSGPSACLECSRQEGGLTGFLDRLCRDGQVGIHYDYRTMTPEIVQMHPIRTPEDVLDWAISKAQSEPDDVLTVRLHTVVEPSKARTITVGSYAYYTIQQVFAHIWHTVCRSSCVRSGMTSTRHMWNFVHGDLNPLAPTSADVWLNGETLWGLSSDLETCTDYANPHVGRQIYDSLIQESSANPNFPVGLARFARDLFFSPRRVEKDGQLLCIKTRGWLMGDPMTKILLTIAQEYVYRSVPQWKIGSMVGDDLVILTRSPDTARYYLRCLRDLDFKVSEADTVISRLAIFYCEEMALVPQRAQDSTYQRIKRSEAEIGYIDYPRIRLLMPIRTEIQRSSYTNFGRFALLGKEARWALTSDQWAPPRRQLTLSPAFERAVLIQHCTVPRDSNCFSSFLPAMLGGDDSFYPNGPWVEKYISTHCSDPREAWYRMDQLARGKLTYRFCRTDKPGVCTHSYLKWVTLAEMEDIVNSFPEGSVIRPQSPAHRALLESMVAHRLVVTPEVALIRADANEYFSSILSGRGIPAVSIYDRLPDVKRPVGRTNCSVDVSAFLRQWRRPGFTAYDHAPYFLEASKLESYTYLNLGWDFKPKEAPADLLEPMEVLAEEVCRYVLTGHSVLSEQAIARLPLFLESDNWLEIHLASQLDSTKPYYLVSADRKLGRRLLDRFQGLDLVLVHPLIDLMGLNHPIMAGRQRLVDPGAEQFYIVNYFDEGFPTFPGNLQLRADWDIINRLRVVWLYYADDSNPCLDMGQGLVTRADCPEEFLPQKHLSRAVTIGGAVQRPVPPRRPRRGRR